ncbi:hypothetical protein C0991_000248 [Blastosporella zonata]|nr:hypothetical protein C0991_000248 [Blastosporella zonata]
MRDSVAQDELFTPIRLPCGRIVDNRLVKVRGNCQPTLWSDSLTSIQVAMYEHLADFLGGPPNEYHYSLYSKWAESGWGMVVTGNVGVSNTHLTLGRDIVIPKEFSEDCLRPFKRLAASMHGSGERKGLAIMQLSHAGRQSINFIGGRLPFQPPLAPSSISIRVAAKETGWLASMFQALAFQEPLAMSLEDIDNVVEAFVKGARAAFETGFDGIQVHAAHGYLLAQFISPKSNVRKDDYSARSSNALRLVRRIVSSIRSRTSKDFIIGIKLNAADYATQDDSNAFQLVLDHFKSIAQWGQVDFIEVSGGDYEKPGKYLLRFLPSSLHPNKLCRPEFMAKTKSSRQALFSDFSKAAMDALESLSLNPSSSPLILLTGGLRTPELLHTALASRHSHLLGIGKGSILSPDLPRLLKEQALFGTPDSADPRWSTPFSSEPDLDAWPRLRSFLPRIPFVGAGVSVAWYVVAIRRLAKLPSTGRTKEKYPDLKPDYTLGPFGAIFWMWVWMDGAHVGGLVLISLLCLAVAAFLLIL